MPNEGFAEFGNPVFAEVRRKSCLLDEGGVVGVERLDRAVADEVDFFLELEPALQQLALDEPCALFDEVPVGEQRAACRGVERFHADFGFDELCAQAHLHVADGRLEGILFGGLEEVHEECPEGGLFHVKEK